MEDYKIKNYKKELKILFRDYLETARLDDNREREVINEDNFEDQKEVIINLK